MDPVLLEVADEHARVLARDVAEDHVALGLVRHPLEEDEVACRGGRLEQFEHTMRAALRNDDPQVDHGFSL
jgi:hypothetical protein